MTADDGACAPLWDIGRHPQRACRWLDEDDELARRPDERRGQGDAAAAAPNLHATNRVTGLRAAYPAHPKVRRRAVSAVGMWALLCSGCTTSLGPKAVRSERPDYNQQIVRSADAEMLLNLVRLRYNETPLFLDLGSIVATYGYDASFNAGGSIPGKGDGTATLGTALAYAEHPTITYSPLTGDKFATRMLTPIPLDLFMLAQNGWSDERLLLLVVQRVNELSNAPTAAGPTPEHKPDYEAFADFAERVHRLQSAGLIGLSWDMQRRENGPPAKQSHLWLRAPTDPHSPLAADVATVRRDLDLDPSRNDFHLTDFPSDRQPNEVGIRCRSLLGVLYFLSQSVEVPAPDMQAGLVTVTRGDGEQVFDWSAVTRRIMTIHSQQHRPEGASVAVPHRGWWFYIAADDQTSKSTFSLLNILFSLQSSSSEGRSPLLTLPIGR